MIFPLYIFYDYIFIHLKSEDITSYYLFGILFVVMIWLFLFNYEIWYGDIIRNNSKSTHKDLICHRILKFLSDWSENQRREFRKLECGKTTRFLTVAKDL